MEIHAPVVVVVDHIRLVNDQEKLEVELVLGFTIVNGRNIVEQNAPAAQGGFSEPPILGPKPSGRNTSVTVTHQFVVRTPLLFIPWFSKGLVKVSLQAFQPLSCAWTDMMGGFSALLTACSASFTSMKG
jgi:hypothetical protein